MKKCFLKIALFMILIAGSCCFISNQSFARTSSSWSAVGSGVDFPVASFAVYNNELYVGGTFTNFIAKWNGTSWSQVGSGMDNYVYTLAVYNNKLYAEVLLLLLAVFQLNILLNGMVIVGDQLIRE